jgi:type IV pilus assembly protein PilB
MTSTGLGSPNVTTAARPDASQWHVPLWRPPLLGPRELPLGEQLIGANLLTADQLQEALKHQAGKHQRIGEALLELGVISDGQLLPFIERQLGVTAVRLREGMIDPEIVRVLPRRLAERLNALAMFKVRDTLCVAMSEPQNLQYIDQIERATGLRVRAVFAFQSVIERLARRCYENDFQVDSVTADLDNSAIEVRQSTIDVDASAAGTFVEGSPIVNLVNYLVLHAVRQGASDIHIEPSRKYSVVRFRVDGQLREMLRPRREVHPAIVSRIKVMARMDIAEHRLPQDGSCQVVAEGKEVDLRISTLPTVLGEKVVIRVLDRQRVTFNLDELGIPADLLAQIKRLLAKPWGLVLVTGPTGSGKTTTLYSALELLRSVHRNIVTVENPVEYQLELINQVLVEESRALTFATALRSILRQDPDIIMVGEIRDNETAEVALQAALTGHLVLSTLHTNNSASAVVRLRDMGLADYKIAAALVGVIAQRLVRTICPHCRASYYPPAELLEAMHYQGDKRRTFAHGEGCRECFDTGFLGRLGIFEVLTVDAETRDLISQGTHLESLQASHLRRGGTTLLEQGLRLAEQEVTSPEEVMRVAFFE